MLSIRSSDLRTVIDHCIAGLPDEACGILAGKDGRVEKVYPMTNAEPGPAFYLMDPQEQFRVMKDMRETGRELVGIYHSHTGSPAFPSATDVDLAYYPEAVYVIVSLKDRGAPAVRGYSIVEGAVREVPVSVV